MHIKLEPADLIAMLLLCAVIVANWHGYSVMIPQSILIVIGYYFGQKLAPSGTIDGVTL